VVVRRDRGDGRLDPGEACDDGNRSDCDGCSATCRVETGCGDGVVEAGEQCDDGNTTSCDGCSAACAVEVGPVFSGKSPTFTASSPGIPQLSRSMSQTSNSLLPEEWRDVTLFE
jgi:cysteine-rich repeat protein